MSGSHVRWMVAVLVVVVGAGVALAGEKEGEGIGAGQAFERLKGLEGTWAGRGGGEEGGERHEVEITEVFEVSANGSVVMETMFPDTPREMINMYHLDGEELVLTHYCSGGNQPTMRLDRDASSPGKLVFVFTGGSNMDPAVDSHIHGAELVLHSPDRLESRWQSYKDGKPVGIMEGVVERQQGD